MKRHIFLFSAQELLPYIDWSYFFHAWGLHGKDSKGEIATRLKEEAIELLLKQSEYFTSEALFTLCDACGDNDNIVINDTILPLLRQQHNEEGKHNLCLSDFVNPTGDKVGLFATTTRKCHRLSTEKNHNDPYRDLLIQTISDRIAEAAATLLHLKVRTDKTLWGYAPEERISIEELHKESYQGIRPAIGYPSLPDQSVIFIIDKLLNLSQIGISLTTSGAMHPHASVCGLMIANPHAHYFAVGKINNDQIEDYAKRRNISIDKLKKFLSKNI